MKNKLAVITAATALLFGAAGCASDSPRAEGGKERVVYHVTDGDKDVNFVKRSLGNVRNHLNAAGKDNVEIRVVMNGDGLGILKHANKDPQIQASVDALKQAGVKFDVCRNTLNARKIDPKKDLYDVEDTDIVPSGVATAAKLQQMGYSYLKP